MGTAVEAGGGKYVRVEMTESATKRKNMFGFLGNVGLRNFR